MRSKKTIFLLLCLVLSACTSKTYTITFDTLGGEVMNNITLKEGETIKELEEPKKEGYLFVSWLKDGIEYNTENPVTENITLTAKWIEAPVILDNYTVTFIIDDKIEKTIVKENDIVNKPKTPEKENYLFLGWYVGDELYDFNNKVTKNIILTAKYELNTVTVTYDLDNGTDLKITTIPKNETVPIPEPPQKLGYKFIKWTLDDEDFSFTTKINENITLKAIWEKIEYVIITYDTDDGNTIESTTIEKYSKIANLPIPEKKGYIFKEWQLENERFNIDTVIDRDITLKAIYESEREEE